MNQGERTIAVNRKAHHDYFILETYEAGLVLKGSEIKSIRAGRVNLRDSYVRIKNGEAWVENMHISPYDKASTHEQLDPKRPRKLLLHKREIGRLAGKVAQEGVTIVPLRLYLKRNRAKLEIENAVMNMTFFQPFQEDDAPLTCAGRIFVRSSTMA